MVVLVGFGGWALGDTGLAGLSFRGLSPGCCVAPSGDEVLAGRALYERRCASCHGIYGEGQRGWQQPAPGGAILAPAHNGEGHTWRHGDRTLYRIVKDGGPVSEATGTASSMPAFKDDLNATEIRQVLGYIKTLWTPVQRGYQAQESATHPYP